MCSVITVQKKKRPQGCYISGRNERGDLDGYSRATSFDILLTRTKRCEDPAFGSGASRGSARISGHRMFTPARLSEAVQIEGANRSC